METTTKGHSMKTVSGRFIPATDVRLGDRLKVKASDVGFEIVNIKATKSTVTFYIEDWTVRTNGTAPHTWQVNTSDTIWVA